MKTNNIKGSFGAGGITSTMVDFQKKDIFEALLDTQSFDGATASSLIKNPAHIEMSASMYANPHNKGCSAHQLDVMILSSN